jgi:hypothetical protein
MGVEAPERNVWWRSASFTLRCRLTMPLCQKEQHGITLIKVVTNPYSLTSQSLIHKFTGSPSMTACRSKEELRHLNWGCGSCCIS